MILIDGAVEEVPESLSGQLRAMTTGGGGRLVTLRHDGATAHGVLGERVGDRLRFTAVFDCATPVLPAFRKQPGFVF